MAGDVPSSVATGKYVRQIVVTAPGPQGPGGVDGIQASQIVDLVSYKHTQNSPLAVWTVVHNLNFFPNVTVFDSGESQVEGSVTHIDETRLTISFSSAIAGKAHLS
jgi:hypothetical protein